MREYIIENAVPMVWLLLAASIYLLGHWLEVPGVDLVTGAALTRVRKGAPSPQVK